MTNIPFPNPHDADALNTYLDALVADKQPIPESDVEAAAQEFHRLASRAEVKANQQPIESGRGEATMHTATLVAPVSNRTRKQMTAKNPTRSYRWLSAVIVAGLLLSMIGSAWLNRENANPNENLAFAPGTAEAIEVLTPESASWIADFSPADCTETSGLTEVSINYQTMPKTNPQGYGIVGPAQAEDASTAVEQYRAMRGCETLTDAWAYWTEARINEHTRVLNQQNRAELAELQAHYAENYPYQFMAIMNDLTISPEIEAEWSSREDAGVIGQPIPLEAKLNPEWAIELSDGRIAFPATTIYSFDDPAIQARGFPEQNPASTVVMIFAKEDGAWKYDDSLALCLVNCENGVGNPLDPAETTWAQPAESRTCTRQPMDPDVQSFDARNVGEIDYTSRQYEPVGPADPDDAASAADTVARWSSCGVLAGEISTEANTYMTPLGLQSLNQLSNDGTGDPFVSAPYLRQWETGSSHLVASTPLWNQIVVLNEPVRTTLGSMQWEPMIPGSTPNASSVRRMQQGFSPTAATELADGRITVFALPTISIEDRGAITYEGNLTQHQIAGVALQQHNGAWLVDELIMVNSGAILHSESDAWWWDESFDEPIFIWTAPITYDECPQDEVLPLYDRENPSGEQYSQEDYDQVSTKRSYEIIGPAETDDALAIATRMRQAQGCSERSQSLANTSARHEYESRTTAGRNALASLGNQRTEGADAIAAWYEDELGLTPEGMWVYQDPNELPADTPGLLQTRHMINPDHAVLLADGRIVTIGSVVTYEPVSHDIVPYYAVYVTIWANENGEWLIDERLPVCFGACELKPDDTSVGGDNRAIDPSATPMD